MRKYALFGLLTLSLGVFSCEKQLELNPEISEKDALADPENYDKMLNGAFAVAFSDAAFGGAAFRMQELLALNSNVADYAASSDFLAKNQNSENPEIFALWKNAYLAVNTCNIVINNSKDPKKGAKALFLRSYIMSELMRAFSSEKLGVSFPIKPTDIKGENHENPRLKSEEVWKKIIEDLEKAKSLLSEETDIFSVNRFACTALLARVCLYAKEWRKAAENASEIIASGKYSLETEPFDIFNQEKISREVIFAFRAPDRKAFVSFRENLIFKKSYLQKFVGRDKRAELFRPRAVPETYKHTKFDDFSRFAPVLRLGEMYLIRAEANIRANTSTGSAPLNDLNFLRNRARASGLTSVTLQDVQSERILELDFEGHNLFDAKRYGIKLNGQNVSEPKFILPIPAAEMKSNPNAVQNEGY